MTSMPHMTIEEITAAVGGQYAGDPSLLGQAVSDVVIDSRKVSDGCLFIPIKGARVDGHSFIPQVLEAGALCSLSEETPKETAARFDKAGDPPVIYVDSTEEALRDLAAWYRSQLTIPVIGITGSFGKTSAKEMIAAVLSAKFNVLKTAGNLNNTIGLPLTILSIRPEHEVAVLEMGINQFNEMTILAKMARPDIAMITTIGDCHLEFLGDRDGVYRAKSEMFDYLHDKDSVAVLRADDEILGAVAEVNGSCPYFYGMEPANPHAMTEDLPNDAYVTDIRPRGLDGTDCVLHVFDETAPVHVPLPGLHMLYHMMAGALAGHLLGMTAGEIAKGAAAVQALPGHGQIVKTDKYIILDSAYNANPASMEATLTTLRGTDRRRVAILGDMGELGENERALHYQVGQFAAGCDLDLLICAGELSQEIARGYTETVNAAGAEAPVLCYDSTDELLASLPPLLKDGDAILVKASHFMGFDVIVDSLTQ